MDQCLGAGCNGLQSIWLAFGDAQMPAFAFAVGIIAFVYIAILGPVVRLGTIKSGRGKPWSFVLMGLIGSLPGALMLSFLLPSTYSATTILLGAIAGLLFLWVRYPEHNKSLNSDAGKAGAG